MEEDHNPARGAGGPLTEDGLAQLIALQIPWQEELHRRLAVETAKLAKIFDTTALQLPEISLDHAACVADDTTEGSDQTLQSASLRKHTRAATQQDIQNLLLWKQQMTQDVNNQNRGMDAPVITHAHSQDSSSVTQLSIPGTLNHLLRLLPSSPLFCHYHYLPYPGIELPTSLRH